MQRQDQRQWQQQYQWQQQRAAPLCVNMSLTRSYSSQALCIPLASIDVQALTMANASGFHHHNFACD